MILRVSGKTVGFLNDDRLDGRALGAFGQQVLEGWSVKRCATLAFVPVDAGDLKPAALGKIAAELFLRIE